MGALRSICYAVSDRVQRARFAGKVGLRAEEAALAWGYRRQPAPHVMTTRNGVRMHFERADYIPLLLDYLGSFEPHCLAVADLFIGGTRGAGRLILDVGGNIGAHALQFARTLGPGGTVVTIEAMPFHADAIRRNSALNGERMATLAVRNVAVGAAAGTLTLALPANGNGGCYSAGATADGVDRYEVPMTTIDVIMTEYPDASVVLIKMDIEGSEANALEGARKTIATHKPAVIIEINEAALAACGTSSEAIKGFFKSCDYQGFLIGRTEDGHPLLEPLPDGRSHGTDEVLFVHPTHKVAFLDAVAAQSVIKARLM